jgi:soluble lytic murein transglycosylase-like protein
MGTTPLLLEGGCLPSYTISTEDLNMGRIFWWVIHAITVFLLFVVIFEQKDTVKSLENQNEALRGQLKYLLEYQEKLNQNMDSIIQNTNETNKQLQSVSNKLDELIDLLQTKKENIKAYIRRANPYLSDEQVDQIAEAYLKASLKYDVPVSILLSVGYQESRFNPNAKRSDTQCYGIMQVNYTVWKTKLRVTKRQLLIIDTNIDAGARILRYYYDQTGDWSEAIMKYYGVSKFAKEVYLPQVKKRAKVIYAQLQQGS